MRSAPPGTRWVADRAVGRLTAGHPYLPRSRATTAHRGARGPPTDDVETRRGPRRRRRPRRPSPLHLPRPTSATNIRVIDPHRLVHHAGRWYLLGVNYAADDWRIFRLDRVTDVARQPGTYRRRACP